MADEYDESTELNSLNKEISALQSILSDLQNGTEFTHSQGCESIVAYTTRKSDKDGFLVQDVPVANAFHTTVKVSGGGGGGAGEGGDCCAIL